MEDKLAAFKAFDFEGHEGWRSYRLNLEVPPGKEGVLERFKAKWYKREIDPDFDVDLVKPPPQAQPTPPEPVQPPRRPPPSSYVPPPRPAPQPQPQPAPAPGPTPMGPGAALPAGAGGLTLLAVHVVLILSAVVSLQPINRYLGWQAYFLCCRTALVASGFKVYLRFGLPRLRPFPAALQPWMQQAGASTEFFHFLLSTAMMQVPQLWMGVVPLALQAAYPALATLRARFGAHPLWVRYGSRCLAWLEGNKPSVLRFCATTEIAMGFQMILAALRTGMRGAMLAWVFWNHLRVRYWAPESCAYHVQAWASIAARVEPVLAALPALRRYLDYPVRWFQQLGQAQHRQ